MGDTISRGVRLPTEYVEVLDYLAQTEQGGQSFNEVVRSNLEQQIDFPGILPRARSFFERRARSIKQEQRAFNQAEAVDG